MLRGIRTSLQLRMIVLSASGLSAAFALFIGLSLWTSDEAVNRTLSERGILARATADRVSYFLLENLDALQAVSYAATPHDPTQLEAARKAIHDTFLQTPFRGGVYLVDRDTNLLIAEPQSLWIDNARKSRLATAVETGKPTITDMYATSANGPPVLTALIPIRDGFGQVIAVLAGDIEAADRRLQEIVRPVLIGATGYAQIVDANARVVAGRNAGQYADPHGGQEVAKLISGHYSVTGVCTDCREEDGRLEDEVISVAPASGTPFSVVVRQSSHELMGPHDRLRDTVVFIGIPLFLMSLAVASATARSVVRPIAALARAAESIARGDLSKPVPNSGDDEIGRLGRTLEQMRLRLDDLLATAQRWNAELERRVKERTRQLQEHEAVRRDLLHKVISAQEEERRRIARELHDETSQSLAALLMALETAFVAISPNDPAAQRIVGARTLATQILDGVHDLIFDLRPSLLDDLGLVAALRWYAESKLPPAGVTVSVEVSGEEHRLPPEVETTLFRALQEAINNIARHACAESAVMRLEMNGELVVAEVEDDGKGFDPASVVSEEGNTRGLGILGMSERVGLLNGKMSVVSRPGQGTRLRFEVPLGQGEKLRVADPSLASR